MVRPGAEAAEEEAVGEEAAGDEAAGVNLEAPLIAAAAAWRTVLGWTRAGDTSALRCSAEHVIVYESRHGASPLNPPRAWGEG